MTTLGDLVEEKVKQRPPRTDESVSYIDISSVNRESKEVETPGSVNGETAPTRARQWVKSRDVLVSMTRPNLNAVAIVNPALDGAVASTGFDVLRAKGVLPEWLFYRVRSHAFVVDVCKNLQGVVYPAIRPRDVRNHRMPLAPFTEQRRIVSEIETHFTRLDAVVVTLGRVQANLKRYRASVLKAAVEGRLVPTEAVLARREGRDYEPASMLLERILKQRRRRWEETELAKLKAKGKSPKDDKWKAKYKEPVKPEAGGLPNLPEGWCWASLDQVSANHDHARVPVKRADRTKRQGDYPYYGASGVIDKIDDYLFDGSYLLVGEDGANLLTRSTPIAFQAHGKFWVNNHAHVLTTLGEMPLDYLELVFNSIDLSRFVTGTAQPKLPQAAMNKIPVPLPPTVEQDRIVKSSARFLSLGDSITLDVQVTKGRLQRLSQSILKWAFEGKLVDQDPNDESASALLERIRTERAFQLTNNTARRGRKKKVSA
jgi:type I restriction enzyme S subunit